MFHETSINYESISGRSPKDQLDTASHNFTKGEQVYSEDALLIGPVSAPRSPLCMGCGVVSLVNHCFECGWPICNVACDKLYHHKSYECEIFKKCKPMCFQKLGSSRGVFHQYDCILPLRMLIFSEKSPEVWLSIQALESFIDLRRDSVAWKKENTYVVKYIRQKCRLKRFSEELIHQVCGILDANCFLTSSRNNLRCLYAISNKFSHSCIPNTNYIVSPTHDFRIYLKAAVDIVEGEKIYVSKVKLILPTLLRRQELIHKWYLSCTCRRCSDPTELESNFSSIRCNKCESGFLISQDSLDFEASWKCNYCSYLKKHDQISKLFHNVEKELNKIESSSMDVEESIGKCEALLRKYENIFHYNHAFMVFLKYNSLIDLNKDTFQITDLETIDQRIIRIYELLNVFDILSPGCSPHRAVILNWLHKAYIAKAKWYYVNISNNCQSYSENMTKAIELLAVVEEILAVH